MEKFTTYTAITICILILLLGGVFDITIDISNWKGSIAFIISYPLFYFTIEKVIDYFIFDTTQIKKAKLTLHELLKKNEDKFEKIEKEITQERNSIVCHKLQIILMHQEQSKYYSIESIKTFFENKELFSIIQDSSLSHKLKREALKQANKYDDNTADITELILSYKNSALLKNEIDIRNVISVGVSVFSAVISVLSLASFTDFLLTRIVSILFMSIIEAVHIAEIYKNNRTFYIGYYAEKTAIIEKVIARVEEKD